MDGWTGGRKEKATEVFLYCRFMVLVSGLLCSSQRDNIALFLHLFLLIIKKRERESFSVLLFSSLLSFPSGGFQKKERGDRDSFHKRVLRSPKLWRASSELVGLMWSESPCKWCRRLPFSKPGRARGTLGLPTPPDQVF